MRLFLDTEWADLAGDQLVSLALVTEDGLHRFYAEVEPLPPHPTDFVRDVVYPLLERGAAAMPLSVMTERLRAFLLELPEPRFVLHDYHHDAVLMRRVLAGQESTSAGDWNGEPTVSYTLIARGDLMHLVEAYFRLHPCALARRHHAGVDAEALRRAYRAAVHRESLGD